MKRICRKLCGRKSAGQPQLLTPAFPSRRIAPYFPRRRLRSGKRRKAHPLQRGERQAKPPQIHIPRSTDTITEKIRNMDTAAGKRIRGRWAPGNRNLTKPDSPGVMSRWTMWTILCGFGTRVWQAKRRRRGIWKRTGRKWKRRNGSPVNITGRTAAKANRKNCPCVLHSQTPLMKSL